MKRLSTILAIVFFSIATFAQAPQKFSYQALIRDAENEIVANRVVSLQVNIVTADDNVIYSETHQTATNANGVVSVAIGTGTSDDDFSQIDWSKGEYYVQTTTDLGAGEQLVSGNSPLFSVPYALYAEKAGNAVEVDLSDYYTKSEVDGAFADYTTTADLNTTLSNYAKKDTLVDYAKKTEVAGLVDLSEYCTKSEVDAFVAELNTQIYKLEKQLNPPLIENGAFLFKFSVSATKQIYFSQGNLQYQASTDTWRFAENQWDYVGDNDNGTVYEKGIKCDNSQVSSTYSGWMDLFGWGTSGYDNKYPYLTSTTSTDYPTGKNKSINGTNYDWGVYNAISNGGNEVGLWRTLTYSEWYYLTAKRENALEKKGIATVNGINGLVLLPDEWVLPNGLSFTSGFITDGNCDDYVMKNNYSLIDWLKMEANGAIFFPTSGTRSGTKCNISGCAGEYWTSSADPTIDSYSSVMYFDIDELSTAHVVPRYRAYSVRLVKDVE